MPVPESCKKWFTPARLWKETGAGAQCRLCPHCCLIKDGESGNCGVRYNFGGSLYTAVGERVAAVNLDPVEKKPLYHFLPGSAIFSVGTLGCNFHCSFCQNSGISQIERFTPEASIAIDDGAAASAAGIPPMLGAGTRAEPAVLVETARRGGARSIAYTYNEPTVFFELMSDTAALAVQNGLRNVMVSNACISDEAFRELEPLIQAANFDLKSFSRDFYRKLCGADLEPVLRTLKSAVRAGWLVELTTLVIAGVNDGEKELTELSSFIAGDLGPDVPWHVSRFRPAYRMGRHPATPVSSLERALDCGKKQGLKYVYIGNLPGHESENTFCPACGVLLVERVAYSVRTRWGSAGAGFCPQCGLRIHGIWE